MDGDATLRGQRHELLDHPLGQRHIGGLTGEGDRIPAYVDVGVEETFEFTQVRVGGTEESEHGLGGQFDAGTHRPGRWTRTVTIAGGTGSDAGRGCCRVADIA